MENIRFWQRVLILLLLNCSNHPKKQKPKKRKMKQQIGLAHKVLEH